MRQFGHTSTTAAFYSNAEQEKAKQAAQHLIKEDHNIIPNTRRIIMYNLVLRPNPMEQRIKLLYDNYVSIYSKYELILELGEHRDTILGESSLYEFIFKSFFKDIILAITRLFENYKDDKSETVHLLWVMEKHEENLENAKKSGSLKNKQYRDKKKEFYYYNKKVKNYYHEHKKIFEMRNRIIAHTQFLYDNEIKDLIRQIKSKDIKDALSLIALVIQYLIDYYEVENLRINKEIISSAKHDIKLLTRVLEEEAEFFRLQFEEFHAEHSSIKW
jgi:hypothetical protein